MVGRRKKTEEKKESKSSSKVKAPAVEVHVTADPDGGFVYRALDADGNEVARGAEGSRNRLYARKVAQEAYPDLPVNFA